MICQKTTIKNQISSTGFQNPATGEIIQKFLPTGGGMGMTASMLIFPVIFFSGASYFPRHWR
jgi:hypothetical protein